MIKDRLSPRINTGFNFIFNHLNPLRRVWHFEGGCVSMLLAVYKIYFNNGLVQIDAFEGAAVINPVDACGGDFNF